MKIKIPQYVNKIINTLNEKGFEAFVVGGAVRDAVLGKNPDDWDVTTNATTEQMKSCFKRYFDTGIKHGTITVLTDENPVEVTTYRIDGEYSDNRRPETVRFTTDIREDLKRRDFTVNAMAYNDDTGLLDLYGGKEDLKNKIIRCVGDADTRFNEDALRILRAIRFSVKLGFEIEENTLKSIKKNCGLLKNISAERIREEILKMLETESDLKILFTSKVADVIIPEVDFDRINLNLPCDKELKLSALLYGADNPRDFFNRLKFDNATKGNVLKILQCSAEKIEATDYGVKRMLNKYGEDIFQKTLVLLNCYGVNTKILEEIFDRVKELPYSIKHLAVTGTDVMNFGIKGKEVGVVMEQLLDRVMKDASLNSKEKLLDILKCIINCDRMI